MACNADYVQFIVDQCSGAGEAVLDEVVLRPPYPSAREHFYVEFQSWLRENAGLTFRDAVEAYPILTHRTR